MGRILALVETSVLLVGAAGQSSAGPCDSRLPACLRISDCRLARSVEDGIARSDTLRALVDRIGERKGIVYVSVRPVFERRGVIGGLSQRISGAGEWRLLQIVLLRAHADGDRGVTNLAHELRHALEVLDRPEIRTEAQVHSLYERIGFVRSNGLMETEAAEEAGEIVRNELNRSRARVGRNE